MATFEELTHRNQNNNSGQTTVADMRTTAQDFGALMSKSQAEFEKFDISTEVNADTLNEISAQSQYLKEIVTTLGDLRNTNGKSLGEQLVAQRTLKDLSGRIENNNDLSKEQKDLLVQQSKMLDAGFKKSSMVAEQVKKSFAEYSDVAVAGLTAFMGNSPVTLFLSKMVTDQAKAFVQRRRDVKENKARLLKAEAIDNKALDISNQNAEENTEQTKMMKMQRAFNLARFAWQKKNEIRSRVAKRVSSTDSQAALRKGSLATQVKEERRREAFKPRTGAKFKATKAGKSGFMTFLLGIGRVLSKVMMGVVSLFLKFGRGLGLVTSLFGGLGSVLGRILSGSKSPKMTTTKGNKPTKGGGMLRGAGRVLSKVAWPITVGMALYDGASGYNDASRISGKKEKNLDLEDKLQAAASGVISGISFGLVDDTDVFSGIQSAQDSISNLFGSESETGAAKRVPKTAGAIIRADSVKIDTDSVHLNHDSGSSQQVSMKNLRDGHIEKISKERAALAAGVSGGVSGLRNEELLKGALRAGSAPVVVSNASTTNNQTTVLPSLKPNNPEPTFISTSMDGAL